MLVYCSRASGVNMLSSLQKKATASMQLGTGLRQRGQLFCPQPAVRRESLPRLWTAARRLWIPLPLLWPLSGCERSSQSTALPTSLNSKLPHIVRSDHAVGALFAHVLLALKY